MQLLTLLEEQIRRGEFFHSRLCTDTEMNRFAIKQCHQAIFLSTENFQSEQQEEKAFGK